jgi:hypothetical protein
VEVRGRPVPFLQCKTCKAVFMQKKAEKVSSSIRRHVRLHNGDLSSAGEANMVPSPRVCTYFRLAEGKILGF